MLRPARCPVVLAVAALAVIVVGGPALSHAVLVRSVPASRAVLDRSPARVQLWFSERVEAAYSRASVWDAAGIQVDGGDAAVSREDPKRLDVTLPLLRPGRYSVRFRILSVDGHVVEAAIPFTIAPGVEPR